LVGLYISAPAQMLEVAQQPLAWPFCLVVSSYPSSCHVKSCRTQSNTTQLWSRQLFVSISEDHDNAGASICCMHHRRQLHFQAGRSLVSNARKAQTAHGHD